MKIRRSQKYSGIAASYLPGYCDGRLARVREVPEGWLVFGVHFSDRDRTIAHAFSSDCTGHNQLSLAIVYALDGSSEVYERVMK